MSNDPISREAKLLIQLGEMGNELHRWKSESLEQARLLAMSADREEKLRAELQQARDCFSAAMELAERYRAERGAMP